MFKINTYSTKKIPTKHSMLQNARVNLCLKAKQDFIDYKMEELLYQKQNEIDPTPSEFYLSSGELLEVCELYELNDGKFTKQVDEKLSKYEYVSSIDMSSNNVYPFSEYKNLRIKYSPSLKQNKQQTECLKYSQMDEEELKKVPSDIKDKCPMYF